jgi:ABC-type Fe3+ transport system substrate-binding protein
VSPNDVPKSALDFLKPQFAGKLVTAYPADDDATLYAFDTIVRKYGWDYMKKYMAQKPSFIEGHLGVLRSVADGSNAVTFDSTSSTTGALKKSGQPIEFAFPTVDVMPTFFITAGIFKDAPHPNAARLFLDWYMAKEQQSRLGSYSSRTDVDPPPGLQPLSAYRIATGYLQFVSDEKRLDALRKQYESYTGPVVNKGGVR